MFITNNNYIVGIGITVFFNKTEGNTAADYATDYPQTMPQTMPQTTRRPHRLCRRLCRDAAHFAGAPPKPKAKQNSQNTLAATIVVPGPLLLPVLMKKD